MSGLLGFIFGAVIGALAMAVFLSLVMSSGRDPWE